MAVSVVIQEVLVQILSHLGIHCVPLKQANQDLTLLAVCINGNTTITNLAELSQGWLKFFWTPLSK